MSGHIVGAAPPGRHRRRRTLTTLSPADSTSPDTPAPGGDLTAIWGCTSAALARSVPAATYRLWFEPLRPVSLTAGVLNLTGPPHVCAWVERRYPELLLSAARSGECPVTAIRLVTEAAAGATAGAAPPGRGDGTIHPRYTFDHFVIGSGNRIAHAAALAVADAPGEAYNPLFLHGPPGLGKTHLMGAIANHVRRHSPGLNVRYVTAERFTNDFVGALHRSEITEFKGRHRDLDVLLLDDVQFLQGKTRTADELFHTFNTLFDAGAQVVLSADRMPSELSELAERLRDRFEWGLIAQVSSADELTRTTILRHLVAERDVSIEEDCLARIAELTPANVRALEGALTRVMATSSLTGERITAGLVDRALDGPGAPKPAPAPTITSAERVRDLVAGRLGVPAEAILSGNRTGPVSAARRLAMYLTRMHTDLSLPAIARSFQRRDHTTVLHAVRAVERKLPEDPALATLVTEIGEALRAPQR